MLGVNERLVSLATLGSGAAIEAFDRELKKVLEDINDVNTKAVDIREVHLVVKIAPDEERERANVGITTKAKMGKRKSQTTSIWLERTNDGAMVAVEETRGDELPNMNTGERRGDAR